MTNFTASDVLQFAIRLEENGESFYRQAAVRADDKKVQGLFNHLADEEIKHKLIFEDFLSRIKSFDPPESYPGEYLAYLRDYMDGRIVFSKDMDYELLGIQGTVAALDFAIQREMDSILYYQELKAFVPTKDYGTLDTIIAEERKHFSILSEAKNTYL
jgi:rubrerythrin